MPGKEPSLFIRMARPDDAEECHRIDVEAWGEESAATAVMMRQRIATYPAGNFVAIDRDTGAIVGSVWTMSADESKPIKTWWETSGGGVYGDACNPFGDLLFGINVSVRPDYNGFGVGEALVIRAGETAWLLGKRKAVLGSRMPEYHKWQDVFDAEDYIRLSIGGGRTYFQDMAAGVLREGPLVIDLRTVANGAKIDPRAWPAAASPPLNPRVFDGELGFFLSLRLLGHQCRIFQLLPGYFPDPESVDNGVMIGWENPAHPGTK